MSRMATTDSKRPVGRAVLIDEASAPLEVVAAETMEVIAAASDSGISIPYAELSPTRQSEKWSWPIRAVLALNSAFWWVFGIVSLVLGLAILASLPILNLLSLGYLLESSGRIGRTGRPARRFHRRQNRVAARRDRRDELAVSLAGPDHRRLRQVVQIIDPGSRAAAAWRVGLLILICLTFIHVASACALGGKFRHFISPFNLIWLGVRIYQGNYYTKARDAVWDTLVKLRLPYYFMLGFRGFVAAAAWLVIPITLLALGSRGNSGVASLLGFVGAFLLTIVLLYLPILQMRVATTNRLREGFNVLAARRDYRRAPWAFTFAFIITLLFALPLYLLKIQIVPREAEWLPSLVFIAFIFPARWATGWAMGRANRLACAAPSHATGSFAGLAACRCFRSPASTCSSFISRNSRVGTASGAYTNNTPSWCRCRSFRCDRNETARLSPSASILHRREELVQTLLGVAKEHHAFRVVVKLVVHPGEARPHAALHDDD